MKNLVLIRHAKSSWDDASLDDRDRPLSKRGKRDAPLMGALLHGRGLRPDALLASPAKRARKTAKLIAQALGYDKNTLQLREALYGQGCEALLKVVAELDDSLQRVFLVGHNPELTELVNQLSAAGIANVPTCGVVSLEFEQSSWRECVRQAPGRLAFFDKPAKQREPASGEETVAGD